MKNQSINQKKKFMQSKGKKLNFKGERIYIGLDVHDKSWRVSIMTGGIMYKTYSQDPSPDKLHLFLEKNFPGADYYSAYESGFCGFSVHRKLEKLGINNIVVNAADIPTTDKDKVQKEDSRDSRKIARSLSNGDIIGIHVPSIEMEELRSLVRYRRTLVKELTRRKNRVKSILKLNGIAIPDVLENASKHWSSSFLNWLTEVKLTTRVGSLVIEETLDTVKHLRVKLLKITRELRRIKKESEYSKDLELLTSIPGIALIVSFTLLTELENIERFKTLDQLSSYIGLIPSTNSSGEKDKTRGITRRANSYLRSMIVESAWVAIRHDPALMLKYSKLKIRMKGTEAIIRIAKSLLSRIRYVLKNEVKYIKSTI